MCGIVGKVDFAGAVDQRLIHRMCAAIEHRGPDSRGTHFERGVGLGMQRLAIIDVSGGDQPLFSEDGKVAVIMNGEIYNHLELRADLEARGHRFATHSDAEVLVHLYEDEGERLVERLRGMFAFAVWDSRRRRLVLGRDRVGKKPLFWSRRGSRVWFASEISALLQDEEVDRSVDPDAIAAYLALQYVPHPLSAFSAIRKLSPATTLTIDVDGERERNYWALDYSAKIEGVSTPELEDQLREQLLEATRIRLMSEVPLGAFLSGGVDSSAVVWAMSQLSAEPVKTFSIGFSEQDHDELDYARLVAQTFATDHHEYVVEPHALEIMPKLARHYGEPFADPSAIPSFYLAELTRRHVTVALNGDGGDEAFGGYDRYLTDHRSRHLEWLPAPLRGIAGLARFIPAGEWADDPRSRARRLGRLLAMRPIERYALRMCMFDGEQQRRLLSRDFAASITQARPEAFIFDAWDSSTGSGIVDRLAETDTRTYLPGALLVKMDIASMAYSVEARSPFLDHKLLEFAASLDPDLKASAGLGKRILKSALRGRVPDVILDRPKMGFGVPLVHWFRNELRDLPREVLLDPRSIGRGYFDPHQLARVIDEHRDGRADHGSRLWVLLQLELWHREVVERGPGLDDALPELSATA